MIRYLAGIEKELGAEGLDDVTLIRMLSNKAVDARKDTVKWQKYLGVRGSHRWGKDWVIAANRVFRSNDFAASHSFMSGNPGV